MKKSWMKLFPKNKGNVLFLVIATFVYMFSFESFAQNIEGIIPKPVSSKAFAGEFEIKPTTVIYVNKKLDGVVNVAEYFTQQLKPATGFTLAIAEETHTVKSDFIRFTINENQQYGDEGYQLDIKSEGISIVAKTDTGLFRALQTVRQLLEEKIEEKVVQKVKWKISNGQIIDYPRYKYRGFMLDVARFFYTVDEVKAYIDQMALYKYNAFHFHLTDDQGWRLEIPSWPKLTTIGSDSAVNKTSCESCFYTLEEFKEIVDYAEQRHIDVIPEIDVPGHVKAALASYPDELYCDGDKPDWPYTDVKVKVSSLCFEKPEIYQFFNDVVSTVAPLINSPYIHVGGDETPAWVDIEDYKVFMLKARDIIANQGKKMIGWTNDLGELTNLGPDVIGQHWLHKKTCCRTTLNMAEQGSSIIMSPASNAYISLKYNESTPFGGKFAGFNSTQNSYEWDPDIEVAGVAKEQVIGIESALWGEWASSVAEGQFLAFPRLISLAEVAWSAQSDRDWNEFKYRLAAHGPRLQTMGINFYRTPLVPWKKINNRNHLVNEQK